MALKMNGKRKTWAADLNWFRQWGIESRNEPNFSNDNVSDAFTSATRSRRRATPRRRPSADCRRQHPRVPSGVDAARGAAADRIPHGDLAAARGQEFALERAVF